MAEDTPQPDKLSGDFRSMQEDWLTTQTVLNGRKALQDAGEKFLPKFPEETQKVYDLRLQTIKFTNIYSDIVENLSSRPFASEIKLDEGVTDVELKEFVEDVDAKGKSMHVFMEPSFYSAIAFGLDWIVVDYTPGGPADGTVADEKIAGVRPFWRRYSAPNCIAVYSDMVNGEEHFIHARFREDVVERVGFDEVEKERVRIWNREMTSPGQYAPPTYEVWEKKKGEDDKDLWIQITPPTQITIGIIPIVPISTGRRKGQSWMMKPPMKDALDLQMSHYRQESGLEYVKTMAAFPILVGNGVTPPRDAAGNVESMTVGPQTTLFAPPSPLGGSPSWAILEPNATSLRFLSDDVKNTAVELRELGRQPLTSNMGNITVITSAIAGQKGAAAIQSWAIGLKNSLERALAITAMWLRKPEMEIKVSINTDFDLTWTDDDGMDHIMAMRASGDISREAMIHEAKRRSLIDKDYDVDADLDKILQDLEDLGTEEDEGVGFGATGEQQNPFEESEEDDPNGGTGADAPNGAFGS